MKRGLPQHVVGSGRYQEASLHDTFRFECKRCGRCCFTCEIVLTPFDILRLCEFLVMDTYDFLRLYAHIHLGPESGLPVCSLNFERVQRQRGGKGELPPCPFLTLDGHSFACGVYPARPGCCRSYPLFRMLRLTEDGEGEMVLGLQQVNCPAADTEQEYTVAEWIEHEGLTEYQQAHGVPRGHNVSFPKEARKAKVGRRVYPKARQADPAGNRVDPVV